MKTIKVSERTNASGWTYLEDESGEIALVEDREMAQLFADLFNHWMKTTFAIIAKEDGK